MSNQDELEKTLLELERQSAEVRRELEKQKIPQDGDYYERNNEPYLLCRITINTYSLISLRDANRFRNPVANIQDIFGGKEFKKITKERAKELL